MGVLNIGLSGLNAAQAGLITTSHNIANAGNAAYTRQRTIQEAQEPFFSGGGFLGTGAKLTTTVRQYDQFVNKQLLEAKTRASELETYETQIGQLDDLLADPEAGLSPALQGFFRAVQDLSANPTSSAARQSTISAGEALASRFQLLDGRMSEIRSDINAQIGGQVEGINAYARSIADINLRIQSAETAGESQPANDLRDQRDQLISELNDIVKVNTVMQSDGAISVFVGNGLSLVVGNQPFQLAAIPDPADAQRTTVGQVLAGGGTSVVPESMFSGGKLSGLLAFRSQTLDTAQSALGQLAMDFVSGFNAQHQLGQTLDGNPGGDFFGFNGTPTALTAAGMVSVTLANTRDVAAASPVATATGAANTGTAAIDSSRVINRTSLPFAGNVTLTFDGATNSFSASGGITAGPFAYAAGQPFTVGGVELTLTGTPANGDTFTLGNNPTGRNDNRNALLLGGVQTASLALGGTANFQSAYASLVADVGSNAREVQITSRAATTLVEQTTATQQGISGVNLDEEAANLLRYQQHYQASSKVIQIAGKIFDEILALGR